MEEISTGYFDYRDLLKQELIQRQEKNAHYSMRAFARDLEVDPGQLSNVIQGKKNISLVNAAKLARKLTDHPVRAQLFYHSVEFSLAKSDVIKDDLKKKIQRLSSLKPERDVNIEDEEFETISQWYHLPLIQLGLKQTIGAKDASAYLGIGLGEAKQALERLARLGFMEKSGQLFRRLKSLTSTTDIPSLAIRQFHLQMMEKARQALFRQPIQKRYFSSVTLRVPQSRIDEYKKIIDEAEDRLVELSKKYENEKSNEVYHFSSQLFSLKQKDYDA